MNRTVIATALAAAASFATAGAQAAPLDTINKAYTLECRVGTDGASLKTNQLMVRNTTPHVIPKGTVIKLSLRLAYGYKLTQRTAVAYRDLGKGETISAGSAAGIRTCAAQVTLQPNLKTKIDAKIGKLGR